MGKVFSRTAQRYTDILNAAAELLREGGMGAVTTDRIRQRINVSLTTVYSHFENRQEILEEVFRDTHAKFYATAEYKLQFARTSEEQLATIIEGIFAEELFTETHMHIWIASINYYLYCQGQFSYAPEAHSRAVERTRRLFLELGDKDPDASPQFWAFVDGLWLHAALGKGSLSRDKCIDRTFAFTERRLGRKLPRKVKAADE
ncbi:TetR/AcrR family transcriptional regulator [Rhizobium sp. CNPSo 4039]|uniref:TetR/AcrR family transcriptional regulator n=1 Tax=Rhizobium sp. CNPSo 4039 TaxID=3021409 RepID=UPI00254D94FD|nr:TetR/AcrR family transcriptional regulator [Rhizobium sp. CNPSo 4039]MDK4717633.1 TetR/AcrR family transcriptional regulator [Rhizobium sp. CNPSo 4039]